MNKDLTSHIEKFYEDNTSEEIEHTLLALESDYYQGKYSWEQDRKLRALLIWCDYEDLPEFVAYIAHEAKLDIESILNSIYHETQRIEDEERKERELKEYDYRRVQGWK